MMYTFDGLWYNLIWYDGPAILLGLIMLILNLTIYKKDSDSKIAAIIGAIVVLMFVPKIITDVQNVNGKNLLKTEGVFECRYRNGKGSIPHSFRYIFTTEDSPKRVEFYLDSFTKRKHLGAGFELSPGVKYEIIYDESTRIIVGLKIVDEDGS